MRTEHREYGKSLKILRKNSVRIEFECLSNPTYSRECNITCNRCCLSIEVFGTSVSFSLKNDI